MEKDLTYEQLLTQLNGLSLALRTIENDDLTVAPKDGVDYRAKMTAQLSGMLFKSLTDPTSVACIKDKQTTTNDPTIKRDTELLLRQISDITNIPYEEYVAFSECLGKSQSVWAKARLTSDYAAFAPMLEQILTQVKKNVAYKQDGLDPYDSLLDQYDQGLRHKDVDAFFDAIETRLVPFIQTILGKKRKAPAFLSRKVDLTRQAQITDLLAKALMFDPAFGTIATTEHPYSSTLSINDNRVTTHYLEDNFTSSMFSVIHEIGHATYNHQVNPMYEGRPLADGMSMTMHESQSRFLENMIGRSRSFWLPLYPELRKIIPDVLYDVSLDEFIFGINYVSASPIRTEADELTYPLHILIRYRIERGLMDDQLTISNLNDVFADKMEEVLGIRPANDGEGVLQDVHWSGGSFGYFPTYALGSACAAHWMKAMRAELDVDHELSIGNFAAIRTWLREHIHQFGGLYTTSEMLERVCHQSFDANIYIDYLIEKYTVLYE